MSPDPSPPSPASLFPRGLLSVRDYASTKHSDGRVSWIDKMKLDPWVGEAPHSPSFYENLTLMA